MSAPLPEHIDILRLAKQGGKLADKQPLGGMSRLRQSILLREEIANKDGSPVLVKTVQEHQDVGFASIELEFGEDDEHIAFIKGKAQASVYMTCQRCLEPMSVELNTSFLLGVVDNESRADQLPERYEALVISGQLNSLSEIIEDELILSVPLVALHDVGKCSASELLTKIASVQEQDNGQENDREMGKLSNPFSILSTLKKEKKKE